MGKIKEMKIYLDNCCYNRPFDDQTPERIHLESEVILTILQRGQSGIYKIIGSDVLQLEIERMNDMIKKQQVKELYRNNPIEIQTAGIQALKDVLGPVGMVRFM